MKQYTPTANDEGVRLSLIDQSETRDFPTSLLYKSFRNKRIKVNGKKGVPEDRIKAGDLIELYINDEFFPPEGAKPVLRDIKYVNRKMNERTGTKTQALCAVRISFLDIPEENTLHYLSGKVIKLKDPQIVKQFDTLDKNKQAPTEEK